MKPLAARTVKNYSNYVKRWEASRMEPEAWLDTLSEANAANARKALRHHLPELRLRYRHEPEPAPKALTKAEIERVRLACANELVRACFDWRRRRNSSGRIPVSSSQSKQARTSSLAHASRTRSISTFVNAFGAGSGSCR